MIFRKDARLLVAIFLRLAPAAARAEKIVSVGVDGTQFSVSLDSGRVLNSEALSGAEFDVALPGGERRRVRIASVRRDPVDPDGDVFLHRMQVADPSGAWVELCKPDATGARWAFPLRGQWDGEGRRLSDRGLMLTCASDVIGKCVRFGHKPWKTGPDGVALADYHAACVKAVRADYCGDRATTRNGQLIDIYDARSIQRRDTTRPSEALPFKAAFSPSGALCVAHTRVPENMTLDALAATCPRLAQYLGQARCLEDEAIAGHYGLSMIFIRSPAGARDQPPPQAQMPASGPSGSTVIALTALAAVVAFPALARIGSNGINPNGVSPNGISAVAPTGAVDDVYAIVLPGGETISR